MVATPASRGIATVSELTRRIKASLERDFPGVWVRGEISNFRRPASGHLYFRLKDDRSVLNCMMWSSDAPKLAFTLEDGVEVEAYGRVSVFEQKGEYQLYVQTMRRAGLGALLLAYEELRRRLQAEGLFDPARKKPLPAYPRRIGLVTSMRGAVIHDLVRVLRGRWPSIGIVVAPVRVQGEGASSDVAAAIRAFNRHAEVDLLIVGRGGGSLEDLWAFNEEPVVRAIVASRIPVVSAIGHEADVTLADLAADVRAATPSHAAELAVRDRREVRRHADALRERLARSARQAVEARRRRFGDVLGKYGFQRPRELFQNLGRRVDELGERMGFRIRRCLEELRTRLERARGAYGFREWPRIMIERRREVAILGARVPAALRSGMERRRLRLAGYEDRLRALSPRRVLDRGYCLARRGDGTLLRSASEVGVGDRISLEFARGEADARIEAVREGEGDVA